MNVAVGTDFDDLLKPDDSTSEYTDKPKPKRWTNKVKEILHSKSGLSRTDMKVKQALTSQSKMFEQCLDQVISAIKGEVIEAPKLSEESDKVTEKLSTIRKLLNIPNGTMFKPLDTDPLENEGESGQEADEQIEFEVKLDDDLL